MHELARKLDAEPLETPSLASKSHISRKKVTLLATDLSDWTINVQSEEIIRCLVVQVNHTKLLSRSIDRITATARTVTQFIIITIVISIIIIYIYIYLNNTELMSLNVPYDRLLGNHSPAPGK